MAALLLDSPKVIILDIRYPTLPVAELSRHQACVNAVAWAPHSSQHICTAGDDSQVGAVQMLHGDCGQHIACLHAKMQMMKHSWVAWRGAVRRLSCAMFTPRHFGCFVVLMVWRGLPARAHSLCPPAGECLYVHERCSHC